MAVFDPRDKTFVVTGGASGMGAAYVAKFVERGAKAVAIIDISVDQGTSLAEKYNEKYPGKVSFFKCDISNEDEIVEVFNKLVDKLQRIDVLINNAGNMADGPNTWRVASLVNWQGVVSFTLKSIKHMSKSEGGAGGAIVNISSGGALVSTPFVPIYCGSKSAVLQFSRCLSMDPFYENTGIRVICMCIGLTETPLLHDLTTRAFNADLGKTLEQFVETTKTTQRAESAVAALEHALQFGANGSVWYSADDKPAKNMTAVVDAAFDVYNKMIIENAQ